MANPQDVAKHVPQRMCIACRQKRPKWELVRIVRTPHGAVEVDARGKKAGRGAYLCRVQDCWETGLTKKKLERALKAEFGAEQRAGLLAYGRTLPTVSEDAKCRAECGREGVVG